MGVDFLGSSQSNGSTVSPSLPFHPRNFAELTAGSGRLPDDLLSSIAISARHDRPENASGPVRESDRHELGWLSR
jgi:hypothetical protein